MMGQIDIFNKAQEFASNNYDLDKDLSNTKTIGLAVDLRVKSSPNMCLLCYLPNQIKVKTFQTLESMRNISRKH